MSACWRLRDTGIFCAAIISRQCQILGYQVAFDARRRYLSKWRFVGRRWLANAISCRFCPWNISSSMTTTSVCVVMAALERRQSAQQSVVLGLRPKDVGGLVGSILLMNGRPAILRQIPWARPATTSALFAAGMSLVALELVVISVE